MTSANAHLVGSGLAASQPPSSIFMMRARNLRVVLAVIFYPIVLSSGGDGGLSVKHQGAKGVMPSILIPSVLAVEEAMHAAERVCATTTPQQRLYQSRSCLLRAESGHSLEIGLALVRLSTEV